MKLGFSTVACPQWDLATIVRRAKEFGYEGVEVAALAGRAISPAEAALADDPVAVRRLFADAGVELVCLGTPIRVAGADADRTRSARSELLAFLDLAARLGCPLVRVFGGKPPPVGDRNAVLARTAAALRDIAPAAAARNVEILIENASAVPGSRDLWFVADAAAHPAVRCCWNPLAAAAIGERPTLSVPRLGTRIGMVRISDGRFGPDGHLEGYALPGNGQAELTRLIELLRGIAYEGYVVFHWPQPRTGSPAPAEEALPIAAKFLRERIDAKGEALSAYKADKTAPRFAQRPPRLPVRMT